MTPHTDILDQPEPLGKSLAGSVALHVSVTAALLISTWIGRGRPVEWGDINGGGMGSVAVNVVPRVPLPGRSGPLNPVANDTESVVPTPPPKAKPRPKVEAQEPNAIAIKSRNAERKPSRAASAPNKFREQQQDLPNQLYSNSGQAVVSPMYGMTGGGGVGIGTRSPFGAQFGWYVNLSRHLVAQQIDVPPELEDQRSGPAYPHGAAGGGDIHHPARRIGDAGIGENHPTERKLVAGLFGAAGDSGRGAVSGASSAVPTQRSGNRVLV